ncbi:M23 family metallopeptidase [Aestuariicoccus sp. MJ-SS9]|uniref:M23 family metallopeptidase n=1 Tax=Aestuariicoccus sp. MJ-SS9 TaxID=3079855 RepID=UPI0029093773|nr:M23 family metallopeptidase [Aestuariicoccus sp. MJ-SS9]MDU8909691.1 M23 family metallopeptidase [Aestuariicoccus sp. MJ-SS9]
MRLLWAILASAAAPAAAEVAFLDLPLDCTLGKTCFIEDYVDADPGPGQADYACGLKSRDGHRGTDIALLSFDAMAAGVPVRAAAAGRVDALRDGMTDRPYSPEIAEELRGRECGNAVRIVHGNGYQTLYCHMKMGSVAVTPGTVVAAGDVLGLVGLSGQTNYPHVHISVLKDGQPVDPFNPAAEPGCDTNRETLWKEPIPYERTGLFTAGFSDRVPEFSEVQSGAARARDLQPDQPMVLYGHAFHAEPGDVLHLSASGPEGPVFDRSVLIEDSQAQMFRAFGKRAPAGGWPAGAYRGYVRLMRGETVIAIRHADVTVR